MRVLWSTHESREEQPLSPPRRAAESLAAQFGTVAEPPEGCGALVTREVLPSGVWR